MGKRQPPGTLYKYRSLGPNVIDKSLSIIRENLAYFAKPEELNDPYEGLARIDTESLRKTYPELEHEDRELEEALRSNMRRTLRVFSLSETYSSSTMWSHYADNHRGICIGIDTVCMSNLEPMEYFSETPVIVGDDPESIYTAVALRKSHEWKYEQEWRAVDFDPQQLVPLPPSAVSEVILGCEITSEHGMLIVRDLMLRSLHHEPVQLYKAERTRDGYSIGRRHLGAANGRSAVDSAGTMDLEVLVDLAMALIA